MDENGMGKNHGDEPSIIKQVLLGILMFAVGYFVLVWLFSLDDTQSVLALAY